MSEMSLSNFTNIPDFSCSVKRTFFTAVHIFPRFYNRLLLNYFQYGGRRVKGATTTVVKVSLCQILSFSGHCQCSNHQELICLHPVPLIVAMFFL
jgi:hypothetical protein